MNNQQIRPGAQHWKRTRLHKTLHQTSVTYWPRVQWQNKEKQILYHFTSFCICQSHMLSCNLYATYSDCFYTECTLSWPNNNRGQSPYYRWKVFLIGALCLSNANALFEQLKERQDIKCLSSWEKLFLLTRLAICYRKTLLDTL